MWINQFTFTIRKYYSCFIFQDIINPTAFQWNIWAWFQGECRRKYRLANQVRYPGTLSAGSRNYSVLFGPEFLADVTSNVCPGKYLSRIKLRSSTSQFGPRHIVEVEISHNHDIELSIAFVENKISKVIILRYLAL